MSGRLEAQTVSRHTHLDELENSAVVEHSVSVSGRTAVYMDCFVKAVIEI
jgi:hypothetical protein